MKKLILYTESSNHVGGQELQAFLQLEELINLQFNVMLACRKGSEVEQHAINMGIPVFYVAFRNSVHLPSILNLRKLIKHYRPILAVCHSGHDANNLGIAVKSLCLKPIILRQKVYLAGKIKTFSLNKLSDKIIVPSNVVKDILIASGCNKQKIEVVYPGINFEKLIKDSEKPLPVKVLTWLNKNQTTLIIQVGMLRNEKGHDTVLAALGQIKKTGYKFRFLIIGDGELRNHLQQQVSKYGLNDDVFFSGAIFPVSPVYKKASLMLMPSRKEAFGMAQVEALSFGIPVIASRVGGIPETIQNGKTGVLVEADNVSEWVNAIQSFFLAPSLYREMAKLGKIDVMARFSINNCVRTILNVANV